MHMKYSKVTCDNIMHVKILSDKLNKQTKFGTSHAFKRLMFHVMHNRKFWEVDMLGHWCN